MKKKYIILGSLLAISLATATTEAVNASNWYGSHITLPRGGTFWSTQLRKSTGDTQGIKASQNAYQVIGEIENKDGKRLGNYKVFEKENKTAKYITTSVKDAKVKAAFRTNGYNLKTTTAYLSWRP